MYSIIQAPNEILQKPAKPVDFTGPKLAKIIAEMKQTLLAQKDPKGVGLAAPQVGLPFCLFIARFEAKRSAPIYTFINPELVAHSEALQPEDNKKFPLEGCLSVPKYYGIVHRWKWVELKYSDFSSHQNLEPRTSRFESFPAVVIQHEMDHLSGKIFVERIIEQHSKLYRNTGKDKKGKDIWEEVEL